MLLRNLFSMSAMRIISALLTLALVVAFSRVWGSTQLGQFALLVTVFLFFQLLPLLGLHLYLIGKVSAAPATAAHHFPNATLLALLVSLALALSLGLGGTALYADLPEIHNALWLVAASLIPTAPIAAIEAILLAQQRMDLVALRNIAENIGRTAISLLLVFSGSGLTAVFITFLCGRILVALSYLFSPAVAIPFNRAELSFRTLREYMHSIPTFLGIVIFGALIARLDILFMSKLGTPEDLGLYAAPYKLYELGLMVPQIITVVLYPRMCELHAKSPGEMLHLVAAGIRYPLLFACPILILLGFSSVPVLSLFGGQAPLGATALILLLPALAGAGINQLLATCMFVIGRPDLDLRTLAIGTVVTVIALFVCIPKFGSGGAAFVVLVMSVFIPAVRCLLLARLVPLAPIGRAIADVMLPSCLMMAIMLLTWPLQPVLAATLGIAAYMLTVRMAGLRPIESLRAIIAAPAVQKAEP